MYAVNVLLHYFIYFVNRDKSILKIGKGRRRLEQNRLPFIIDIDVKETFEVIEDGYHYSYSGFHVYLKRNSLGVLIGGFYLPTGAFSTLSLLSFSISHENVCH